VSIDTAPAWGVRTPLPVDRLPREWGRGFLYSLQVVATSEGGDVDHPDDPGGRTRWGVTQATYHAWLRTQGADLRPVDELTPREAGQIYRDRYWIRGRCEDLPWPAGLSHFDALVQHGPGGRGAGGAVGATHLLQRALGEADDGIWGPRTSEAVLAADPGLTEHLLWERQLHYWRILDNRPSLRTFSAGWRNRVVHLRAEALRELPTRIWLPRLQPDELRLYGEDQDPRPLPVPEDARRRIKLAA
jgi:lysozyme family protein